MANCLYDRGERSGAEELQRDTIGRLRQVLGDSHPDTLIGQGNLAITLRGLGRTDDAGKLLGHVITCLAQLPHGESHPVVVAFRNGLQLDIDLESQPT